MAVSGTYFQAEASPSLSQIIREATKEVSQPGASAEETVFDEWTTRNAEVGPLGSGSDYTPFLQHIGVSSINVGFSTLPGEKTANTQYHSVYDSFTWWNKFIDPTHEIGLALAKVLGTVAMRLADDSMSQLLFIYFGFVCVNFHLFLFIYLFFFFFFFFKFIYLFIFFFFIYFLFLFIIFFFFFFVCQRFCRLI